MQAVGNLRAGERPTASGVLAGWIAIASVAALAVSLAWWHFLAPGADVASRDELVIRRGTGEAIANGYPVFLPSKISLRPGGELRLINEDVVEHSVGDVVVPPGQTAVLRTPDDGSGASYSCTIHPSGSLSFQLSEPLALWQAVAGGIGTGIVMGGVAGGVTLVARKLDTDDE